MAKDDTLNGSRGSRGDVSDADIERGYSDAFPTTHYDGNPNDDEMADWPMSMDMAEPRKTHGMQDEYGFVKRPCWRTDVERN